MPTPVISARQCLTDEAAQALDDAVSVARRRGHAQTTSLHAISALLALPSSPIRASCARSARISLGFSPRLQFRALELSIGVSLDRMPSLKSVEDPPVSNSLMAAIRRSQANQRRHPESLYLNQMQIQQPEMTLAVLKVELKHFMLSILDDPIVSKVFGEAGFRSYDIKLGILNPPALPLQRFGYSRFPWGHSSVGGARGVGFPFLVSSAGSGDENCRRIGEVLIRKTEKNPLLIGASVGDALSRFVEVVHKGMDGVLPAQISGLKIICIEKEIAELVEGGGNEDLLSSMFKKLDVIMEEHFSGPGVVVSFGELGVLVSDAASSTVALCQVVAKLADSLKLRSEKLWLIGSVESHEIFSKFKSMFPSIEKDWDLHLLPITSSTSSAFEGPYPKSSLMGSFVPLGGFFSASSDFQTPPRSVIPSGSRFGVCTDKYDQEVADIMMMGSGSSVSDHYSSTLPSWLQMGKVDADKKNHTPKDKDGGQTLNAKIMAAQKKWTHTCQWLHRANKNGMGFTDDGNENCSSSITEYPCTTGNFFPIQKKVRALEQEQTRMMNPRFPPQNLSNFSFLPSLPTPSVATDLQLGLQSAYTNETDKNLSHNFFQSVRDLDPGHFKILWKSLSEKVGRQDEAILSITQTVSLCRSGAIRYRGSTTVKGDIWLSFVGPDKLGKKRIAMALAETIFGTSKSLVSVDLTSRYGFNNSNSMFRSEESETMHYESHFRGKTTVDYIAAKLRENPHCVVFLEDIEKGDMLVRNGLSQAISTGKFMDSDCREIIINDAIFVTATTDFARNPVEFSEEKILGAKFQRMRILLNSSSGKGSSVSIAKSLGVSSQRKRKVLETVANESLKGFLDLNLPVEGIQDGDGSDFVCDSSWLADFYDKVDLRVVLSPFDFDALAEMVLREMKRSFERRMEMDGILEIDCEAMVQILAAAWICGDNSAVEDWIEDVLGRGFVEARQRYGNGGFNDRPFLQLVAYEDVLAVEDCAKGIRLPAKVDLD